MTGLMDMAARLDDAAQELARAVAACSASSTLDVSGGPAAEMIAAGDAAWAADQEASARLVSALTDLAAAVRQARHEYRAADGVAGGHSWMR